MNLIFKGTIVKGKVFFNNRQKFDKYLEKLSKGEDLNV